MSRILQSTVGGLTLAAAMRTQGHQVTLLEKSAFHQETGAAIHSSPNCTCIIDRLGVRLEKSGANPCLGMAHYHGNGDVKRKVDLEATAKHYKSTWHLIHRADLHDALKRAACEPRDNHPMPKLLLDCRIASIDAQNATVTLEDGTTFAGDMLIGADGIHSQSRAQVDSEARPSPWGKSTYRWLTPRNALKSDPETNTIVDGPGYFAEITEGDRTFIMYPCRNNTMMNVVASLPNSLTNAQNTGLIYPWRNSLFDGRQVYVMLTK